MFEGSVDYEHYAVGLRGNKDVRMNAFSSDWAESHSSFSAGAHANWMHLLNSICVFPALMLHLTPSHNDSGRKCHKS